MADERHTPIDIYNPLSNPAAQAPPRTQSPSPDPAPAPSERNEELEGFLNEYFGGEPVAEAEPSPSPVVEETPAETPAPSAETPASPAIEGEQQPETTPAPPSPSTPAPPSTPLMTAPPLPRFKYGDEALTVQEMLERGILSEIIEKANNRDQLVQTLAQQYQRREQPEPSPQAPQPLTPDQLLKQYQPRMQQYVEAGWLDEDFVTLYPKQAALMVHMWDMGTQLEQGVQQTTQYVQTTQKADAVRQANAQLDKTIDAVVAKGDVFDALKDAEVRKGFREYLINDVNPMMSQITPDFLARQFYAFNHQLILDTVRQAQQPAAPLPTQPVAASPTAALPVQPSAAQLARQEGGSARVAPTVAPQNEWDEMIVGLLPAR